ncbi:coiled-coil domain-containing protein 189 [Astyanax mexicanus]|uniref:coiled-coil domain-containing protein 189 n=1 Tax=Astyanax mexicanus TaxID=7994 RepID=UPI0020CAA53D|nr:coiled-coil domain-containing protein 189 [Astyanax mexicanus]
MKKETLEPCIPKARVLLWADLSYSDMEEMDKADSITDTERILCRALKLDLPEPRLGILLEMFTNLVRFCREQHFNREQTSVLLSIVKNVHQLNTETPLNNMDQCFSYCSELLLCHSVRRPPFSVHLFDAEQLTQILQYLTNTYMRHYKLYKYIFTPQMYLDLSLSYTGMPEEAASEEEASDEYATGAENETGKVAGSTSEETASAEILTTDTETLHQGPSPKTELRTIVEKEVKDEVMRLTAQLEKRLQESTDQLNTALTVLEANIRSKK